MSADHVDGIIAQWNAERPDVDVSGMAVIGRIGRLDRLIRPQLDELFAKHDLESWEFDVLATLRRSGEPFRLSAGQLLESMMITSGTMTNRLDRLEGRSLIERGKDERDGRVVLAALTASGKEKIDEALSAHADNECQIVGVLSERDQRDLIRILRRFGQGLSSAL